MRKSKELKRTRRLAAAAYKKGDVAEAIKGWAEAAKGYKERLEKKRNKNKPQEAKG